MTESVYRYAVPIDGRTHQIHLAAPRSAEWKPLAVAAQGGTVEFWAVHSTSSRSERFTFQVFGTGWPLPEGAQWRGTTSRTPDGLVWHLFEVPGEDAA